MIGINADSMRFGDEESTIAEPPRLGVGHKDASAAGDVDFSVQMTSTREHRERLLQARLAAAPFTRPWLGKPVSQEVTGCPSDP